MMLKRCIDVTVSLAIMLLASPIYVAAGVAIWLESGRPILFRQQRVGKNFKCFEILKFRTMRVRTSGPPITVGGDIRITTIGRILRATKLDEFPQFWNVLRGDMSIVGPRPEVAQYVEMFKARYFHILTFRPGITDLASIYFWNEEAILAQSRDPLDTYKSRILPAKLDLAELYIRDHSAARDISIILQTVVAILRRSASVLPE